MFQIPREAWMLRSRLVHRIHEMSHQGVPVAEIARTLGISRPTVRKYREGAPPAKARQPKSTKLDPYKEQVRRWVAQDHCLNCVVMVERLRLLGYTGGVSQLKRFVHPLRPARAGKRPVLRYKTKPGEQLQFDIRNFRVSCPVGRRSARLGLQASGASESRHGGVARGLSEPLGASGLRAARLLHPALVALVLLSLRLPRTRARMLVRADPSKSLLPGRGRRPLCSSWDQILAQSLEDVRSAFMSV